MTDQERNELRAKVAELLPESKLFVIHKPKNDPFGFYRENAGGYTSSILEAWKVTEEQGRKYTLYADAKPGTDAYYERVVLKLAPIPDYPNDLNACHEFEKMLTQEQQRDYAFGLSRAWMSDRCDNWRGVHADAEQRCRAFVATMEKKEHHGR